jgi:hypothetical protein
MNITLCALPLSFSLCLWRCFTLYCFFLVVVVVVVVVCFGEYNPTTTGQVKVRVEPTMAQRKEKKRKRHTSEVSPINDGTPLVEH